jgi:hypothetical protein
MMKGSIVLKSMMVLFLTALLPKLSLAYEGRGVDTININQTFTTPIQDTTHPGNTQTVVNTDDKKKVKTIKALPKPHRQPVPVPVNVKVPRVKIIQPIVKPVIKVLH